MGLDPNLMEEPCNSITAWQDQDSGTGADSSLDTSFGFNTFKFDAGTGGSAYAQRGKTIASPPNLFTLEVGLYCATLGTLVANAILELRYGTATWSFRAKWATNGLFIVKTGAGTTEVGTDIVPYGDSVFHVWRFQIDKTAGESSAVVEVFLDGVSQGTVDCDYEVAGTAGYFCFKALAEHLIKYLL
jgi:hypothetical protein